MFLKEIKIRGFKSFARPVTINFDSAMTAIVGPNGSGKSNIVDAVRWVLGEQSARTLRGRIMSDVIFAGSDGHDPLNKARVALIIDDQDQVLSTGTDRVKIERRVNDNGESDYLLNGKICRLKDIEELLLDTGLGKDTYSIIGQGKIDTIINSKPEALRELFEEAAGITRFKARKEETEKKLDKTDRDLTRIKDLIAEHQKRLKPLTKEADKARKYRHLRSNLQEIEISLLLSRWEKYSRELEAITENSEYLQENMELKQGEIAELKQELQDWEDNLETTNETFSRNREKRFQLQAGIDEIKNKVNINQEKQQNIEREIARLKKQKIEFKEKQDQFNMKYTELEDQENRYRQSISLLENKIAESESQLQTIQEKIKEKKEKLTELRDKLYQGQEKPEEIKEKLNDCREQYKLLGAKQDELQRKKEEIADNRDKLQDKIEDNKNELQDIKDRKIKIEAQKTKTSSLLQQSNSICDKLQIEIKDLTRKLNENRSRLELLQEMETEYRGYYRGVKNLLQSRDQFQGIVGVIAEIIDVKPGYEKAIETALGNKIQNIAVEKQEVAREAIDFLNRQQAGRATFLPLNRIKGQKYERENLEITGQEGYEGLASQFVTANTELDITGLIDYLLGRTIVAADIDWALEFTRISRQRLRIVTISGEIIYPSGAITGGKSGKQDSGLLARSRELKTLPDLIAGQEEELERKQLKLTEEQNRIKDLSEQINNREKRLYELGIKINNIEQEIIADRDKLQEEQNNYEQIKDRLSSLQTEREELKAQQENLTEKINHYNNRLEQKRDELEEKTVTLNNTEEKYHQEKDILGDKQVELARLTEKQENVERKKKEIAAEVADIDEQLELMDQKIENNNGKIEKLAEKQLELVARSQKMKQKEADLKTEGEKMQRQLEQLRKLINSRKQKIEDELQKLEKIREELHKVNLKVNRLEGYCERDKNRLEEEYDITPARDEYRNRIDIKSQKKAKNKIREIKDAMQRLEPVNEGAIREFEELKDRVFYLQEQQADLIEAREGIISVIDEIEKSMGQRFYTTFKELAEEFSDIFKELFGGGKAELQLNKPDDLLQTGVEIIAQPPGKQLKKLSLLSGGERALSAIALIFALLRVKPSPFYILDEIDAPLDDANVIKFGRFIQNYADFAQFIIITHRKHMMTRVDSIYGVTMEESGISKIISLNFRELIEQTGG